MMSDTAKSFTLPVKKQAFLIADVLATVAKEDSLNLLETDKRLLKETPEALHVNVKNALHHLNNVTLQKQMALWQDTADFKEKYIKEIQSTYHSIRAAIKDAIEKNQPLFIVLEGDICRNSDKQLANEWEMINPGLTEAVRTASIELSSRGFHPSTMYKRLSIGSLCSKWIITLECSFL